MAMIMIKMMILMIPMMMLVIMNIFEMNSGAERVLIMDLSAVKSNHRNIWIIDSIFANGWDDDDLGDLVMDMVAKLEIMVR